MPQFDSQTQVRIMGQLNGMHSTVYDIIDTVNGALQRDEELSTSDKTEIENTIRNIQEDLRNLKNIVNAMKRKGEDLRSIERIARKMCDNISEMKNVLNKGKSK